MSTNGHNPLTGTGANPEPQPPPSDEFAIEIDEYPTDQGVDPAAVVVLEPAAVGVKRVRLVGAGAYGQVWEGRSPEGETVAVKLVPLGVTGARLERRALNLLNGVRHPNLVAVHSVAEANGSLVVTMEFADGGTLADQLKDAPTGLPLVELIAYMRDAAAGLDFLNFEVPVPDDENGVQHRDIKPSNLLLFGGRVRIGDFGLAQAVGLSGTAISGRSMTIAYAAPELFADQVSRASDQYSLAATYFHLRTGRLLFPRDTPIAVMHAHVNESPDLSLLGPEEARVVAKALAKSPHDRWRTSGEFVAVLEEAVRRDTEPRAVWVPSPVPAARSRSGAWAIAGLACGLLVAGGFGWWRHDAVAQTLAAERDQNRTEVARLQRELTAATTEGTRGRQQIDELKRQAAERQGEHERTVAKLTAAADGYWAWVEYLVEQSGAQTHAHEAAITAKEKELHEAKAERDAAKTACQTVERRAEGLKTDLETADKQRRGFADLAEKATEKLKVVVEKLEVMSTEAKKYHGAIEVVNATKERTVTFELRHRSFLTGEWTPWEQKTLKPGEVTFYSAVGMSLAQVRYDNVEAVDLEVQLVAQPRTVEKSNCPRYPFHEKDGAWIIYRHVPGPP